MVGLLQRGLRSPASPFGGSLPNSRSPTVRLLALGCLWGAGPALAQGGAPPLTWPTLGNQTPTRRYVLSEKPRFTFGTAAGPDATLLNGVVGATQLASGTLAVGDAGNNRVVFVRVGAGATISGRSGDGPGEFRALAWVGRCGPTEVGAYDGVHNRLTLLDGNGTPRAAIKFPPAISFDQIVLCKGEREQFILVVHPTSRMNGGETVVVPTVLVRLRDGSRLDTIAAAGVQEYYVGEGVSAFVDKVLGRASLVTASGDVLYVCDNQEGLVTAYSTTGARPSSFRLDLKRLRVSPSDWTRALADRLAAHPYPRSRLRIDAVLRQLTQPQNFPLVWAIRGDPAGYLWVRTFDNYGTSTSTWIVVASTGALIARIATPRGLDIREIGLDYVLGMVLDEDGVQRLVTYDLTRE